MINGVQGNIIEERVLSIDKIIEGFKSIRKQILIIFFLINYFSFILGNVVGYINFNKLDKTTSIKQVQNNISNIKEQADNPQYSNIEFLEIFENNVVVTGLVGSLNLYSLGLYSNYYIFNTGYRASFDNAGISYSMGKSYIKTYFSFLFTHGIFEITAICIGLSLFTYMSILLFCYIIKIIYYFYSFYIRRKTVKFIVNITEIPFILKTSGVVVAVLFIASLIEMYFSTYLIEHFL